MEDETLESWVITESRKLRSMRCRDGRRVNAEGMSVGASVRD